MKATKASVMQSALKIYRVARQLKQQGVAKAPENIHLMQSVVNTISPQQLPEKLKPQFTEFSNVLKWIGKNIQGGMDARMFDRQAAGVLRFAGLFFEDVRIFYSRGQVKSAEKSVIKLALKHGAKKAQKTPTSVTGKRVQAVQAAVSRILQTAQTIQDGDTASLNQMLATASQVRRIMPLFSRDLRLFLNYGRDYTDQIAARMDEVIRHIKSVGRPGFERKPISISVIAPLVARECTRALDILGHLSRNAGVRKSSKAQKASPVTAVAAVYRLSQKITWDNARSYFPVFLKLLSDLRFPQLPKYAGLNETAYKMRQYFDRAKNEYSSRQGKPEAFEKWMSQFRQEAQRMYQDVKAILQQPRRNS